ncbi:MAG TPA: purine-nucleoside phosphorylase [Bacteroidetes bacterium]|nr:purine-nucleoside phosphorylase [Bacteroidota bacterium]
MSGLVAQTEAADYIRAQSGNFSPEIGLILGSGLGVLAEEVEDPIFLPYADLPGFPVSTVKGHAGRLVLGTLEGRRVMVMQGRFHYYEGHNIQVLAHPVQVMKLLGVTMLVVTNAAGGVNPSFRAGDLMLIQDHINMAFNNPLMGANLDELGPRFPDTSRAYSQRLKELARTIASEQHLPLQEGIYQFMTGPTYETPAEVRMAQKLGADAVGMSTVPEVHAAVHCGIEVLGISSISNLAAGISDAPLSHAEVVETTGIIRDVFIRLVRAIVRKM